MKLLIISSHYNPLQQKHTIHKSTFTHREQVDGRRVIQGVYSDIPVIFLTFLPLN